MRAKTAMKEIIRTAIITSINEGRYHHFLIKGESQRIVKKKYKSGCFNFRLVKEYYGFYVSYSSNRKFNHGWESHIPINKIAKSIIASGFIFQEK